jgi:hypothetical protein
MSQKNIFLHITAILAIFLGLKVIHIVSLGNGAGPMGDPAVETKVSQVHAGFLLQWLWRTLWPPNFAYLRDRTDQDIYSHYRPGPDRSVSTMMRLCGPRDPSSLAFDL